MYSPHDLQEQETISETRIALFKNKDLAISITRFISDEPWRKKIQQIKWNKSAKLPWFIAKDLKADTTTFTNMYSRFDYYDNNIKSVRLHQ